MHLSNTSYQHALLTHPINPPYQCILAIFPINTPYKHIISTLPINPPLSMHLLGMGGVANAVAHAAREYGAEIVTNATVTLL